MTAKDKKQALLTELAHFKDAQQRFAYVVEQGRRQEPLKETFKIDAYRVEGCLAKLWLVSEFKEGKCYFHTDSESAIMKGISTVLCNFYSDLTPLEIVSHDPSFLAEVGITQHLTPNRRNGLARVWEKIRDYAQTQLTSVSEPKRKLE
ncbi:SufE family protein [Pedosphaera parvula]|uniref:Fe-S metabolism associated SufE n=1 Tax=Pedosphaera parvula (strain Ellin514) TaxID=320771 RepID=B9XDN3_PEDPL|nr:SufE family protein [Pedosphaera parvula]EEF62179.1 Fe-S metabolism associated SufE [Pedosphaera parvula Ellin514]